MAQNEIIIVFKKIFIYLAEPGLSCNMQYYFSCGMWDLVPPPGTEPDFPALGVES